MTGAFQIDKLNEEMNKEFNIKLADELSSCRLCPRNCGAARISGKVGYCGQGTSLRAARAALHFWEEPVLSGCNGSGAVFFSGCNLRCIFCQNYSIALGECGKEISIERLAEIFIELQDKGAHNINLVTATPYIPHIRKALEIAKASGLSLPIVYNSSGYESVEALKTLDGMIDIYLPDLKYYSPEISAKYSHASDYFECATNAIAEMYRQVGKPVIVSAESDINPNLVNFSASNASPALTDYNGEPLQLMKKGIIVRHLLLPGQTKDSKKVLRYLHETYGDNIYISIMNQYTPLEQVKDIPELNRRVSAEEYDRVVNFAIRLGIENAFIQGGETAQESFIPAFNYEGL